MAQRSSGGGAGLLVVIVAVLAILGVLAVALAPYAERIVAGWRQVAP